MTVKNIHGQQAIDSREVAEMVGKQHKHLLTSGTPYIGMVVNIKLTRETNKGGVDYAKIALNKTGLLPAGVVVQAKELRRQMKDKFKEMSINIW